MKLLNQILAIIFYILFFYLIFLKIRNIIFVKKTNCKEIYKKAKIDIKNQKAIKYLFRFVIINIVALIVYLAIGIVSGISAFIMTFITLGGIMYVDTGADSTSYNSLMNFVGIYFSVFKYVAYYMYFIVYTILIRLIYINKMSYKKTYGH